MINRSDVHEVVKKEWRSLRDPGREVTGRRRIPLRQFCSSWICQGAGLWRITRSRESRNRSRRSLHRGTRLPNAATMPIEDGLRFVQPN